MACASPDYWTKHGVGVYVEDGASSDPAMLNMAEDLMVASEPKLAKELGNWSLFLLKEGSVKCGDKKAAGCNHIDREYIELANLDFLTPTVYCHEMQHTIDELRGLRVDYGHTGVQWSTVVKDCEANVRAAIYQGRQDEPDF